MTVPRLFAILVIFACTVFAWFVLGGALDLRTSQSGTSTSGAVTGAWGPPMMQQHPTAYYQSPGVRDGRATLRPKESKVKVTLQYEPKRKGLLWYRTYVASFQGEYTFDNPTPIPQTIFVQFSLPTADASYNQFSYTLNGKPTTANVTGREAIVEAVVLQPAEKAVLAVVYKTRGLDQWGYSFGEDSRVQNFALNMKTDFDEIDFPAGSGSPSERQHDGTGWQLTWSYPDEIGARSIGMDMPKVLNPGPTASRITFFAPVSLLFFFAILIILCLLLKVDMHPMNYFFLSAGCFAFQLLFAYLVDIMPIGWAFAISALISLTLVSGYLLLAFGMRFARLAGIAQFCYMILFSYSFFFDGLTGLMITIGAIVTLAILMVVTAKVNWSEKFERKKANLMPPPVPGQATTT
jgi:Inner membrane protein CreD